MIPKQNQMPESQKRELTEAASNERQLLKINRPSSSRLPSSLMDAKLIPAGRGEKRLGATVATEGPSQ